MFSGKKVALFAVPGAFTPTCHQKHLPSFLAHIDEFKKKGVDSIVCIAVNDPFVLGAWEDITGAKGKVLFLSDGNAEFTKKIGMDFDGSGFGLGTRSKRYSMLVESGVIKAMNVEDSPAACSYYRRRSLARRPLGITRAGTAPCLRAPARPRAHCHYDRYGP